MRIAVTGASGFVGGAVARALAAADHDVLTFGRRPGHRFWDITHGPLGTPPPVDAVIHCAGGVTDWGPASDLFAVNLLGTRNVLATWPGARFVHVSTASVYDARVPHVMTPESAGPAVRHLNAYSASKAAAERLVLSRPDAVVLRPHAVYGPGDTTLLPRVLSAVRGPVLPAVGTGRQRISLTSIGNLVHACRQALTGPPGVYNVTDAEPVLLDTALRALLAERGVRARPLYLPHRPAKALAALAEGTYLLARSPRPPHLTRYAISHLAQHRTYDITAARAALAYLPAATSFKGAATW
ncbi:NAD-dependent epimerase/dehydratase family protein [Actinomadura harenae]|uniref:NAD-dependent epimerase/dehydratase family protein n=1 Tax=Actinomadura harenae TaxID=2483351 RepID=A0A3M2LVD7_9ACTN|nr:NAD-dependent epimerase/dehydratase family protein [Actinomadura harenae]RMI41192.1 NAD-dependent epimerase/dehydratase family protein [Actinomadura harenae]